MLYRVVAQHQWGWVQSRTIVCLGQTYFQNQSSWSLFLSITSGIPPRAGWCRNCLGQHHLPTAILCFGLLPQYNLLVLRACFPCKQRWRISHCKLSRKESTQDVLYKAALSASETLLVHDPCLVSDPKHLVITFTEMLVYRQTHVWPPQSWTEQGAF